MSDFDTFFPAAPSGVSLLQTLTPSAAATTTLTAFTSAFDSYFIVIDAMIRSDGVGGDTQLQCRFKLGGSFHALYYSRIDITTAAVYNGIASDSVSHLALTGVDAIDNLTANGFGCVIEVLGVNGVNEKSLISLGMDVRSDRRAGAWGGAVTGIGVLTEIEFSLLSGDGITARSIKLYGRAI